MPNPNPGPQNLQWLTWRDFTPGIVTRTGALAGTGSAPGPVGSATLTNTYRCVCLPQGGLTGLPSRTFNRANVGSQNSSIPNVTLGSAIVGPIAETQGYTTPLVYNRSTTLHQAYILIGTGGLTTAYVPTAEWDVSMHILDDGVNGSNRLITTISTGTVPAVHYSPVWMTPYTRYTTSATWSKHIAYSWVIFANSTLGNAGAVVFPKTTNNASSAGDTLSGTQGLLTMHQSRLIAESWLPTPGTSIEAFSTSGQVAAGSAVKFTSPNQITEDTVSPLIPDPKHFSGVGTMASLTASDLLVIYVDGGASLVQGDLGAPVIRSLPNVPGTGGLTLEGAATPLGFVYLQNRGGAYLWQGGDGATLISSQLDDDFFYVTNSEVVQQYTGVLAFWRDYVLLPNNWLWDTKTQSWWQIELQSTLTFWQWRVNPLTNMLYGFVFSYTGGSGTNLSGWSPVTQTTNYSWQSQPFYPAEDRQVQGMELLLVAQGAGTVTFTITALDTGETNTIAVTTSGTDPKYYRENMNGVSGATMQIRAVSDGGSSPAPTIHEFRLGYLTGYPVPAP